MESKAPRTLQLLNAPMARVVRAAAVAQCLVKRNRYTQCNEGEKERRSRERNYNLLRTLLPTVQRHVTFAVKEDQIVALIEDGSGCIVRQIRRCDRLTVQNMLLPNFLARGRWGWHQDRGSFHDDRFAKMMENGSGSKWFKWSQKKLTWDG